MPYSPNSALASKPIKASALTIRQQVAQLFMVGYTSPAPNDLLIKWVQEGLGGIIFFRDNFQHMTAPNEVSDVLANLQKQVPGNCPPLLMGIDQEGGQVERLPFSIFPTLLTPKAIAQSQSPEDLAASVYDVMADYLKRLGFNLNFFPTLDVNLNPKNPVIGVRSFGTDPNQVWQLAQIACKAFEKHGILPVGKHFPGHGNGTVDSHETMPNLVFTDTELGVFKNAIKAKIPAMMVSHGYYPDLQADEPGIPASASPAIIQKLLKAQCGFKGVVMSDDMCMGAIAQGQDPVSAALAAFEAGIDFLIYRDSTEEQWTVFEALVEAVETNKISKKTLTDRVNRVLAMKAKYQHAQRGPINWNPETLYDITQPIADAGLAVIHKSPDFPMPLDRKQKLWMFHPDRAQITNYAYDQSLSPELPELFAQAAFREVMSIPYPVDKPSNPKQYVIDLSTLGELPDVIIAVSFNPLLQPYQQTLFEKLSTVGVPIVQVAAGMPDFLGESVLQIGLSSYRPPSMIALVRYLVGMIVPAE